MVKHPLSASLAFFFAVLLWANTTHANDTAYISLEIDSNEVFSGDTVGLNLESTGLLEPIDFSPLLEHATLLRETTGTRISVINGKVVEIKLRWMYLQPKSPGLLVIGPLLAGDISSNSVHVNVLDQERPDWQPQTDDLQIKTTLTPESALVNQQVVLSIELLHRYALSGESVSLPELSEFSHRTIYSERRTFKDDNKEWYRTEWRYLLFPRESGVIDVGSIEWSGTALKSRSERAPFSRTVESLKLSVAKATDTQSSWWLPGTGVKLTEAWSEPPTTLRAGDELERTITIEASDVLAGQIPTPVVPESRAIRQTLIDSKREENITGNSITSKAVFTYRVKAQSPIPVFLDTVRIPWWDTVTNEAREAIIPARRINVGLPDRADLLSKAALQETGVNRVKHWLQATDWLRTGLYCLTAFAVLFTLWNQAPALRVRNRKRKRLNTCITELKKAARAGDEEEVYRLLQRPELKKILGGAESELVNTLASRLYSRTPARTKTPRLMDMIRSIETKTRRHSSRMKFGPKTVLAEL